jgi:hypothetical protein
MYDDMVWIQVVMVLVVQDPEVVPVLPLHLGSLANSLHSGISYFKDDILHTHQARIPGSLT